MKYNAHSGSRLLRPTVAGFFLTDEATSVIKQTYTISVTWLCYAYGYLLTLCNGLQTTGYRLSE